ncbi:hypothetical protein DFH09DRAFT_1300551 [Mycena vulgaris]|nr:hypothetical protein DFH09DRAFT_1300551 [Mycena vulgaris]
MAKNSGKRKREETSEEEEEEEEEETYTVEVITHARVADASLKDPWEYHVKWAGYGSDDDTWEPAVGLMACQRLLASFWDEIGLDDKDYPEGTLVEASEKWIKKERKRFKTDYATGMDEKRKQKERADRRKEEKFAAKKAAKKRKASHGKETPPLPSRSGSSTSVSRGTTHRSVPSYSAPLLSTSALSKKKQIIVSESSDSDDDRPLANLKKRKISPKAGDPKQVNVRRTDSHDRDKRNASASSSKKNESTTEIRPTSTSSNSSSDLPFFTLAAQFSRNKPKLTPTSIFVAKSQAKGSDQLHPICPTAIQGL